MRLTNQVLIFIIAFIFCSSCQLLPKEASTSSDKTKDLSTQELKIGLFISGAGALTFSAIPVLELFNKEKIKFSVIAGTGWGAWLSALYAKNQSVDELKWHIFKLKEHGIFGTKWFNNKKKRVNLLTSLTEEILPSVLSTSFVCPALGSGNRILWLTGRYPKQSVFSCLNKIPPTFFRFKNSRGDGGSLFAASQTLDYIKEKGVNLIVWIKPAIFIKQQRGATFDIFWRELSTYLKTIQKINSSKASKSPKIVVFEPESDNFSLHDFSKLDVIMQKASLSYKEQQKFYQMIKK